MNPSNEIRRIAFSYLDQQEIAGNAGFQDPKFESMMKLTGSDILISTIHQIPPEDLPFSTTIIKNGECYNFS